MIWYEDEVKRLEKDHLEKEKEPHIVFYGSSSIRLWKNLEQDFPDKMVMNLGFGGSTLAACVWFFQRIMLHIQPRALVIYAGDNDLGDGRNPEEVFIFFQQLAAHISHRFNEVPCYFISLKPSLGRIAIIDKFRYTNDLIKSEINQYHPNWKFIDVFSAMLDPVSGKPKAELFQEDGLHLSEKGYALWKEIVNPYLI